jgi:uncharacterized protein YbbC (DUF1343 family)
MNVLRAALVASFALLLAACAAGPIRERRARAAVVRPPTPRTALPRDERDEREGEPVAETPRPTEDGPFHAIDVAVEAALAAGKLPGCVVAVGRRDEVLFERAYGSRSLLPERTPMTTDTVFDLASLTKPIATATSIMILAARKRVDLGAPAARYVPELRRLPPFTVEQLLLHTSGLPSETPVLDYSDRPSLFRKIGQLPLKGRPGERFLYSDVGFVVLEEIVRRVSGKDLGAFAREEVFAPLEMEETTFLPEASLRSRAAPTEQRDGAWIVGEVHDPRAFALGGVAGHAGLFSTSRDLVRYAQALLGRGTRGGRRILDDKSFATFVAPRAVPGGLRALGWDVQSRFSINRSSLLSSRAFGHGGFTGTALWVDPASDLFVVFLSNRVHPDGTGAVNPLIAEIATAAIHATEVSPGVDVLRTEGFARLRGARIGLLTNATARTRDGAATIDVLRNAPSVSLRAVFTPEHGLAATLEGAVADGSYAGVPVFSLYGDRSAPSEAALDGIDTIVVDLQDAGVRFYTYASTMKRVMRVAAARKMRFVVLDRPNPLGGAVVGGPVLAPDGSSFVNHHALPIRHGMTLGELAGLFAEDERLPLGLEVVRASGWQRRDAWERTRLNWFPPSPNLRTPHAVMLYPALGLLEATNLSVGRGTDAPFERIGAPWMDSEAVLRKLAEIGTPGVTFESGGFTPTTSVHAKKACAGLRVIVTDAAAYEPIRTGLALASALHAVHPEKWEIDKLDRLLQWPPAMAALRDGKSVDAIMATWSTELDAFRRKRERFLLYR